MNFDLTPEQKAIKLAAREFAEKEFDKDLALELDSKKEFPWDIWKKACELGFIGVHFPMEYGGQGYGLFEHCLVIEEFCRKDSSIGTCLIMANIASEIILRFGTEEQKEKYLIPITKAKAISAGAFTEPDGGSDITSITTNAVKEGDDYIINGNKIFISNGAFFNYVVVLCQTNKEANPPHSGHSTILVERDRKGLEINELGEKMGLKMASTAELSFSNVKVPQKNLIGRENHGFYQAMEFFNESRIAIAVQALGIAQGAFERALNYAKGREAFGKKIILFQAIQHKLSIMLTKIEVARLITYKAAWYFDQGKADPKLTSMAKLYAPEAAVFVCNEAIQIFGGYGYFKENEVERFYRDVRITEIWEGTKELQKNLIARNLIKNI
jgi:alkylation response protein AidB-like acyl-CoA dehydrogenase